MDVTAITMRKKPIYLSILSQMPPSESSKMRNIGRAAAGIRLLHAAGLDNVSAGRISRMRRLQCRRR